MATFGNSKCDCGQNKDVCDLSCIEPLNSSRNDVSWFECDDRGEQMLAKYPDNKVLVLTNVTFRIDSARGIRDGELSGAKEKVIRFAFFN